MEKLGVLDIRGRDDKPVIFIKLDELHYNDNRHSNERKAEFICLWKKPKNVQRVDNLKKLLKM